MLKKNHGLVWRCMVTKSGGLSARPGAASSGVEYRRAPIRLTGNGVNFLFSILKLDRTALLLPSVPTRKPPLVEPPFEIGDHLSDVCYLEALQLLSVLYGEARGKNLSEFLAACSDISLHGTNVVWKFASCGIEK
jgi:hypothetical protein